MKKYFLILIFCCLVIAIHAQNLTALRMKSEPINLNTQYLITVYAYSDCAGIPTPDSINVCATSVSNVYSNDFWLYKSPQVVQINPMDTGCNFVTGVTTCNGGAFYGVNQNIYTGVFSPAFTANDWTISYRSNAIMNSPIATQWRFTCFVTINNLDFPGNNTSFINTPPVNIYCLNHYSAFSFFSTDVDGDSLVYQMDNLFDPTPVCPFVPSPVSYFVPCTPLNPCIFSGTPTLNIGTGILNFTIAMLSQSYLATRVTEYDRTTFQIKSVSHSEASIISSNYVTAVQEINLAKLISIYPNPAHDNVYIKAGDKKINDIKLVDMMGKVVYSITFTNTTGNKNDDKIISVKGLQNGLYFLKFITDKFERIKKIIVE